MLLSTITPPSPTPPGSRRRARRYLPRCWKEEAGNDQLKTHLRGLARVLRSRLPELVHHALSVLITQAAQAAGIDPD